MSDNIPRTQLAVLSKCISDFKRGVLYTPHGKDYNRAHALVRRGLIEPIHGRKGEGIEQFRPTAAGRVAMGT